MNSVDNDRMKLDDLFKRIDGIHVYYQPPENVKLKYPAIVYKLSGIPTYYADNKNYITHKEFSFTLIDNNPSSKIIDELLKLPMCSIKQPFIRDNIYNYPFTIYI